MYQLQASTIYNIHKYQVTQYEQIIDMHRFTNTSHLYTLLDRILKHVSQFF